MYLSGGRVHYIHVHAEGGNKNQAGNLSVDATATTVPVTAVPAVQTNPGASVIRPTSIIRPFISLN